MVPTGLCTRKEALGSGTSATVQHRQARRSDYCLTMTNSTVDTLLLVQLRFPMAFTTRPKFTGRQPQRVHTRPVPNPACICL